MMRIIGGLSILYAYQLQIKMDLFIGVLSG